VDRLQDDLLRKIALRLERRNQRRLEGLLAWLEILDALGWSVALRLPGGPPILSENAAEWLRVNCGESPAWEDIGASLSACSPERYPVSHPHVHLWAQPGDRAARDETGAGEVNISKRETEVLGWLREGKTAPEIAVILGISPRTVENHVARIYRKLGLHERSRLLFRSDLLQA